MRFGVGLLKEKESLMNSQVPLAEILVNRRSSSICVKRRRDIQMTERSLEKTGPIEGALTAFVPTSTLSSKNALLMSKCFRSIRGQTPSAK